MNAICGLWRPRGRDASADCARMVEALGIYGRDRVDSWSDGDVALGWRLKRLLPEDANDRQPTVSPGGRYVVVADARIDDRHGLAADLGLSGDESAILSDGALLAAALERWNEGCLERLVGVFAVAAWDRREKQLLLARDPFGQRPLFYHRDDRLIAFASMPGGLHVLSEIPRRADEETLAEYFAGVPPTTSRSFFKNIERVLPGHFCVLTANGQRTARYWNPSTTPIRLSSHEEYVEAMRGHLDVAVASQLRGANMRVGGHLSGGLDSAAVTSTAARLLQPSGGQVVAFTAVPREGFEAVESRDLFLDEGPRAAATAALYSNIEHVLVRSDRSPLDDLDQLYSVYGQPTRNICNTWVQAIFEEARRRGLTVLLMGLHGNTTLSYEGGAAYSELVAGREWLAWFRLARATVRRGNMSWGGVLMNTLGPWVPGPMWERIHELTGRGRLPRARSSPLKRSVWSSTIKRAFERETYFDLWGRPMRTRALETGGDSGPSDKGALGHWGIDCRDPTADQRLARFSFSIPNAQFVFDGEPKALARHVLADRVSPSILADTKRGYQGADWYEHLTRIKPRLLEELERIEAFDPSADLIDTARLRGLLLNWPKDGWDTEETRADYRASLLQGISAAHFLRKASGSNV